MNIAVILSVIALLISIVGVVYLIVILGKNKKGPDINYELLNPIHAEAERIQNTVRPLVDRVSDLNQAVNAGRTVYEERIRQLQAELDRERNKNKNNTSE